MCCIVGDLIVRKTKQPLRMKVVGQLAALLERIEERKAGNQIKTAA